MICPVDPVTHYCSKHKMNHELRFYQLSQDPGPLGEMYRKWWDNQGHLLQNREENKTKLAYPSKIQQAKNFASATTEWIKQGKPTRTDEECQSIHKICEGCEFFDKTQDRCKKCGCGLSSNTTTSWVFTIGIPDAIKMASHHCPIGKW